MKPIKPKECAVCKESFMPFKSTQKVCSTKCAIVYAKDKSWKVRKKELKEKTLTDKGLLQMLQRKINELIRKIDKNQACISSGRLTGQMQAGHFWTAGANPNIRFNLFNIWLQSSTDNNYKSGNINNYRINIEKIFGSEIMDLMDGLNLKYPVCKLSKIEIKEKIEIVKSCILEAKKLPKLTQSQRIEYRVYFQNKIGIYK